MEERKVYQKISGSFNAWLNCTNDNVVRKDQDGNLWEDNHFDSIQNIIDEYLPSGSGIDSNTTLDFDASKKEKLVLNSSYHVMNDTGYYNGWIDYRVIITPSLQFGFDIKIVGNFGKYRDDLYEYLIEVYSCALDK